MAQKKSGELLYIITRKDLPIGDQAVQSCHAVEVWKHTNPSSDMVHTMALLVVKDMQALEMLKSKLRDRFMPYEIFREPDMGNELTAIACLTEKKALFKDYKKLGES